jgi:hypothetical protein
MLADIACHIEITLRPFLCQNKPPEIL